MSNCIDKLIMKIYDSVLENKKRVKIWKFPIVIYHFSIFTEERNKIQRSRRIERRNNWRGGITW